MACHKERINIQSLGLRVEPIQLENRIYGLLAVVFGAIGAVIGAPSQCWEIFNICGIQHPSKRKS